MISLVKKPALSAGKTTAVATAATQTKPKAASGTPSWMRRGLEGKKLMAKADALAEKRKEEMGKLFRFYLKDGNSATITFLDGELDETGTLNTLLYYEHRVPFNAGYEHFVCTQEEEGQCPICAAGDNPSLVGLFTVVDHTEVPSKKTPGKIYRDQCRLFVAKRTTLKQLQKLAEKRGGLTGCTFDVTRTGEKSAAVGDMFDFQQKREIAEIQSSHTQPGEKGPIIPQVADYGKEVPYRKVEELVALGVGKEVKVVGKETHIDKGAATEHL